MVIGKYFAYHIYIFIFHLKKLPIRYTYFLVVTFFPLMNLVDVEVFFTFPPPPPPPPPNVLLVLNDVKWGLPFAENISSKPKGLSPPNGENAELSCVVLPLL